MHQNPHTCGSCPDQKGYFIAGFDWWIIPSIWKTSESADYWTQVSTTTQSYVSEVETDQYFAEIQPWDHYALKYSGQIDWTTSHIVTKPVNVELQSSGPFDFSSTYVYPSFASITHAWIDDVPKYSEHLVQASARLLH